jgi:vacuolar-type H+-ATPase subunit H
MPEREHGMPSKDLLEKLFDVEREAEEMVAEARAEAGRRLDAARTRAQKYYTEAYDAALAKALAAREQSDRKAREDYANAIKDYREKLASSKLDRGALTAACDDALRGTR